MTSASYKTLSNLSAKQLLLPKPGTDYFFWVSRETSLVREEIYLNYLIRSGLKGIISISNNSVRDTYLEKQSGKKIFDEMGRYLMRNWKSHIRLYSKRKKNLISSAKTAAAAAMSNNRKAALKAYRSYCRKAFEFSEYLIGAWGVIYYLELEASKNFGENVSILSAPEQAVEFLKMRRELFKLPAEKLAKKYGWLRMYNPHDKAYSISDFKRMISQNDPDLVTAQFLNLRQNKKTFRNFLNSIKDPELERVAEIVHAYAFLKTDRIDSWKRSMFYLRPFFTYTARLAECSLREACQMTAEEIERLLKTGAAPTQQDLNARIRHSLFYFEKNRLSITTNGASKILRALQKQELKNTELTGVCACTGSATGKVKIISSSKDLHKIRRGDIFVAKYTFPTFTPAMAKAAAIVTDEGGLTSHASIVSREFHIPCIVGVGNATEILRDGDRVEVDANKGTVKKII